MARAKRDNIVCEDPSLPTSLMFTSNLRNFEGRWR